MAKAKARMPSPAVIKAVGSFLCRSCPNMHLCFGVTCVSSISTVKTRCGGVLMPAGKERVSRSDLDDSRTLSFDLPGN